MGRPFLAAIDAVVVVGTVAIVFAIGLIVLGLVADQIGKREAVMHRDVIYAGARIAAIVAVQIRGGRHAGTHVTDQAAASGPVAAERAPVTVVPLRPSGRKGAGLVAIWPKVPRLGDQFDAGQNRVLAYRREEPSSGIETMCVSPQRRREVETESIDVTGLDPVAQRVHDHLQHARMR